MARKPQNIKITPKLIEFEDHILRVPNIATVTVGRDPRRVYLAIVVTLIAIGSLVQTASAFSMASAMRDYGAGISAYAMPFGTLLFAVAALWYARRLFRYRALVISTADGRFTALVDRKPEFAREVMSRIREALLAGEEGNVIYQVNVQAEKIERLDANSTVVSNSSGAVVAGGAIEWPASAAPSAANATIADLLNKAREQVAPVAGRALQTASDMASRGRSLAEEHIVNMRSGSGPAASTIAGTNAATSVSTVNANTVKVNAAAPGAMIAGGSMSITGSHVSTNGSIVNELDGVIAALSRMQLEHRDEILAYIKPVRDHLAGGPVPREEAKTRWAWFAANVASAMSGIDGAIVIIERVSRLLGIGR